MFWRAPTAVVVVLGLSALTVSAALAQRPLSIADIQGAGSSTPVEGTSVTVEGVVTADLRSDGSYGGIYIQSAQETTVEGASDGIFVEVSESPDSLATSDLVTVTGVAAEVDGETQIVDAVAKVLNTGVELPAAAQLPDGTDPADLESFEGMLVEPVGSYTLESTSDLDTDGSLQIADAAGTTFTLDDGLSTPIVGERPFFAADATPATGSSFTAPTNAMVLGETAGGYRLEPSHPVVGAADTAFAPSFSAGGFVLGDAPTLDAP